MMAKLSREQRAVLAAIQRGASRNNSSPMEVKAAVQTGLVENNLTDRDGGDADSNGWRQSRASIYGNPDLDTDIDNFFKETKAVKGKYSTAGSLAAAVQRPAAQYRGRYQERSAEADAILRSMGEGVKRVGATAGVPGRMSPGLTTTTPTFDEAGYAQATRRSKLASFLSNQNPNNALLQAGVLSTAPVDRNVFAGTQSVTTPGARIPGIPGRPSAAAAPSRRGGASAAVDFAKSRIGQYRESAGSNRGPQLDSLQKRFGMSAQPWCAMFTSVAATRGGMPASGRTASVSEVRRQVQSGGGGYKRGFQRPKAGDMMLFANRHIAMVDSVNKDGSVNLLNGNGSDGTVSLRKNVAASTGEFARPKYRG